MNSIKTVWLLNSVIGTIIMTCFLKVFTFSANHYIVLSGSDFLIIAFIILLIAIVLNLLFFLMDIMLNKDVIDALSSIIHRDRAYDLGKKICKKLRELIPRQQFEIAIQASIGAKIIARESLSALRKDVTAKCYGGDISRKRKLLEKQKEGKKRMRQVGNVEIPQSAFMAVLKLDD